MAVSNVTIRGIQRLLAASGAPTMDRERIVDLLRRAGRAARRLLARAADQLRDRVRCLAGDDIFFHRTAVKVLPSAASPLSREQLLDASVALWWSEHRVVPPGTAEAERASREAWSQRRSVEGSSANAQELLAAVASLIEQPRRSSSLVEALNSRLRVLQMVHRNVSDDLLALVALRWNLTTRIEGRRRGACPFVELGIDFADGSTPWYGTLLRELDTDGPPPELPRSRPRRTPREGTPLSATVHHGSSGRLPNDPDRRDRADAPEVRRELTPPWTLRASVDVRGEGGPRLPYDGGVLRRLHQRRISELIARTSSSAALCALR